MPNHDSALTHFALRTSFVDVEVGSSRDVWAVRLCGRATMIMLQDRRAMSLPELGSASHVFSEWKRRVESAKCLREPGRRAILERRVLVMHHGRLRALRTDETPLPICWGNSDP